MEAARPMSSLKIVSFSSERPAIFARIKKQWADILILSHPHFTAVESHQFVHFVTVAEKVDEMTQNDFFLDLGTRRAQVKVEVDHLREWPDGEWKFERVDHLHQIIRTV